MPIFKKRKKTIKEKPEEIEEEVEKPVEKQKKESGSGTLSAEKGLAWKVLKEPHITEKATNLTKQNQYIFKVFPKANKREIKKAIEGLFGVNVLGVRIIKVPRKRRRLGRVEGWRVGYKKAIVKIKEGQKIEVLPR